MNCSHAMAAVTEHCCMMTEANIAAYPAALFRGKKIHTHFRDTGEGGSQASPPVRSALPPADG